jgi:hypothetical protein
MPLIAYRGNLSAATWPYISKFQGRTIIVRAQDNNFSRQLESSLDTDKDIGQPMIYYCHNVMPTGNGFQSVGYEQHISAIDGTDKGIKREFTVRDDSFAGGSKIYLMLGTGGFYWTENENLGYQGYVQSYWDGSAFQPLPANVQDFQVTTAHVAGITYIYIATIGCFVWDFANSRLTLQTLTGLNPVAVVGITESNGYLIAYSANAASWSSLIDPTDFTPSLQTGAGGGNVEGIKGNITCGAPTSNGLVLYTEKNAVSVLYTGNAQYPFQFNECVGAGGVSTLERVSYDADSGYNYAYTSFGMQVLKAKAAESVFPDVTDFLAGQWFEDFDDTALQFAYQALSSPMQKKLAFIANRFLVISYGVNELTHALVYDAVQKRWGKLKFTHTDVFQYDLLSELVSDIPKKSIALVTKEGAVYLVNFAIPFTPRSGTLLLGKYQYVRENNLQLQQAALEEPGPGMICYDFVSADGKNYSQVIKGIPIQSSDDLVVYGFGAPDGKNHSLLLQGAFNITSVELKFNTTGRM